MNFIKKFAEYSLYSKYTYLEYVVEVIICVYYTNKFFKNSNISYDEHSKMKTLFQVIFNSLIGIFMVSFLYEMIIEPIVVAVFDVSNLPLFCKPIFLFLALLKFEKEIEGFNEPQKE